MNSSVVLKSLFEAKRYCIATCYFFLTTRFVRMGSCWFFNGRIIHVDVTRIGQTLRCQMRIRIRLPRLEGVGVVNNPDSGSGSDCAAFRC